MSDKVTRASASGRRPEVVLLVETASLYARQILSGISRYLEEHGPWSVFLEVHEWSRLLPSWLTSWRGDGIISRLLSQKASERLRSLGVPMVNLNDFSRDFWPPLIRSDDHLIGQLAAEHFQQSCFRHFAFYGISDVEWSRQRCAGFRDALRDQEVSWSEYESPWDGSSSRSWESEQRELSLWLQSLPKPVAVLAAHDERGRHIIDACYRASLAVPDEVAVLGVDNDVLLCELCHPPLSSVIPNGERIGFEAAALLDHLMSGGQAKQSEWLIPPLGVVTRQSTDMLAIDDPDFVAAVRYIRQHACRGTSLREVLKHVPLSRTLLERKFRKYLGHSPQAEIRALQLRRVKQLLIQTDLSLDRIAAQAGYTHAEYMSTVFKRATGLTPGDYRRQMQSPLQGRKLG